MVGVSAIVRRSLFGGPLAAATLVFMGACSQPAPPPPAAPVVKTAEARTQWYEACWDQFNNKAWDQFQTCYDENAVSEAVDSNPPSSTGRANIVATAKAIAESFPDRRGEVRLILANGDKLASIALYTGTNTGPLPPGPDGKAAPATGKAIGMLMAHTVDLDPTGSVALRDADYSDEGTMMAQLGLSPAPARPVEKPTGAPPTVVIAKQDAAEQANLAATRAMFDAVNAHDLKAIDAMTPDDYRGIEIARPKDVNKKESMAGTKEMFNAFPDVRITPVTMWAAGDYVVIAGTFEGTNTGDMPSMRMKKTGKKVSSRFLEIVKFDQSRPKEDWLFYNGAAWAAQLGAK